MLAARNHFILFTVMPPTPISHFCSFLSPSLPLFSQGALKSGPSGFVIGIGLGVVGVAVSPMLGVTDGLNSVAQTIFIQSAEGCLRLPVRPARTLNCPEVLTPQPYPMVGSALVLPALDLNACKAQAAVLLMAKKRGQKDSFVGFLSLVSTAQYYATLCYAMLCCAVLCYVMLCYAMLCCAMLYHVMELN